MNWRRIQVKLLALVLVVLFSVEIVGCSGSQAKSLVSGLAKPAARLSEVAPPPPLEELKQVLQRYQPQVKILSPRPDEVLQDNQVTVRLQVKDLPVFQNQELELGPHLHVILDNQPYLAVYDASEPLVLKDLEPGSHTLRVFASRPWHESFKNEGAYAQTTFHIFTQTPDNRPAANQPLLTYSRPKGSYGAEPIMLDFYLTNAPLHFVATEDAEDDIPDWRVRCTVNGESFTFDRWEPIYLKGFKPGKNWIQLELLDEHGDPIPNAFNNTVRIITYEPGGTDTLSKLVRGELTVAEVLGIVDPNYVPPAVEEPEMTSPSEPTEPPTEPSPESTTVPQPPVLTSPEPSEPETTPEATEATEAPAESASPEPASEEDVTVPSTQPVEIIAPDADSQNAASPPPLPDILSSPDGGSGLTPPESDRVKQELSEEVEDFLEQSGEPSLSVEEVVPWPELAIDSPFLSGTEADAADRLDGLPTPPLLAPSKPEPSRLRELFNRSKGFFESLRPHPEVAEEDSAAFPLLPEAADDAGFAPAPEPGESAVLPLPDIFKPIEFSPD